MTSRIWDKIWNLMKPWITKEKGKPMRVWRIIFALLAFYLLYQMAFMWTNSFETQSVHTDLPENKVAFVLIEEKTYGVKRSTFRPLLDSLKMWEFDEEKKIGYFKFESLLPTEKSKVMLVYDKGFDSFERYAEVVSVNTFPYTYAFKSKPMVSIYNVEKNGTVYLEYEGKKIKLEADDSYGNLLYFDGFRPSKIKITNYGLFDKKQFKKMEIEKKKNQFES